MTEDAPRCEHADFQGKSDGVTPYGAIDVVQGCFWQLNTSRYVMKMAFSVSLKFKKYVGTYVLRVSWVIDNTVSKIVKDALGGDITWTANRGADVDIETLELGLSIWRSCLSCKVRRNTPFIIGKPDQPSSYRLHTASQNHATRAPSSYRRCSHSGPSAPTAMHRDQGRLLP